jgi:hypothetical protein
MFRMKYDTIHSSTTSHENYEMTSNLRKTISQEVPRELYKFRGRVLLKKRSSSKKQFVFPEQKHTRRSWLGIHLGTNEECGFSKTSIIGIREIRTFKTKQSNRLTCAAASGCVSSLRLRDDLDPHKVFMRLSTVLRVDV